MRLRRFAAALPLLACAIGASYVTGQQPVPVPVPMTPQQVLSQIHAINKLEIEVGRLAQAKSPDSNVQRYGKLLERDHRFDDRSVLRLAKAEGVTVQTIPPSPQDQTMVQMLRQASGKNFDRQFLKDMKAGHDKAIAMLDTARAQSRDPRVTGLISRLLPILHQHDELAVKLQS